jgi:hypothetical protein
MYCKKSEKSRSERSHPPRTPFLLNAEKEKLEAEIKQIVKRGDKISNSRALSGQAHSGIIPRLRDYSDFCIF